MIGRICQEAWKRAGGAGTEQARSRLGAGGERGKLVENSCKLAIDKLANSWYNDLRNIQKTLSGRNRPMTNQAKTYRYEVTYRRIDGQNRTKTVEARNEFEALQLCGAFCEYVISMVNLDR